MLLDEFRSSKYCSKHRFELSDIVEKSHHAVCGKCMAHKDDAESLVRKRFALKDINDAIAAKGKRSKEAKKRKFSARVDQIRKRVKADSSAESTPAIINDIAFLLGSDKGGDTIVQRGPSGRKVLHYLATRSPPAGSARAGAGAAADAVHWARTMIANVRLKQLTRRQLVERRRRLAARARCAKCPKASGCGGKQPKRCNNCRHIKEMNKHKSCFLCKRDFAGPDDVHAVARRKAVWRHRTCIKCNEEQRRHEHDPVRIHRDRNAALNFCFIFGGLLVGVGASGERCEGLRLYPFHQTTVEGQDRKNGKPLKWQNTWFGGQSTAGAGADAGAGAPGSGAPAASSASSKKRKDQSDDPTRAVVAGAPPPPPPPPSDVKSEPEWSARARRRARHADDDEASVDNRSTTTSSSARRARASKLPDVPSSPARASSLDDDKSDDDASADTRTSAPGRRSRKRAKAPPDADANSSASSSAARAKHRRRAADGQRSRARQQQHSPPLLQPPLLPPQPRRSSSTSTATKRTATEYSFPKRPRRALFEAGVASGGETVADTSGDARSAVAIEQSPPHQRRRRRAARRDDTRYRRAPHRVRHHHHSGH